MLTSLRRNRVLILGIVALLAGMAAQVFRSSQTFAYDPDNPLLVDKRQRLDICVNAMDAAEGVVADALKAVRAGLDELAVTDPLYRQVYGSIQTRVNAGCAGEAHLYQKGLAHPDRAMSFPWQKLVTFHPSDYRVYVWVVPEDDLNQTFGGMSHRTVAQEIICASEHVCTRVSNGLYVSPNDLSDPVQFQRYLAQALDIAPKFERLTDAAPPSN